MTPATRDLRGQKTVLRLAQMTEWVAKWFDNAASARVIAARLITITLAYFITGRLGLEFATVGSHVTLIWLPTGIAVAALFRWGWRYWPAVWLGALWVNLAIGGTLLVSLGISVGNTLGPVLGVALLRRWHFNPRISNWSDVPVFVAGGAFLGMAVSATGGIATLALDGLLPWSATGTAWIVWWLGDSVGVVVAGMALVTFDRHELTQLLRSGRRKELFVLASLVAVIGIAWVAIPANPFGYTFLASSGLLALVWVTLRLGPFPSAIAVLTLSACGAWTLAAGRGPILDPDINLAIAKLWAGITTISIMSMLISALSSARTQAEKALSEATEELRLKKEEAEKASIAKSRFLAAASHDLRQPMHALSLFTGSLREEVGGQDRARNLLDRIQSSVDSMVQMFDALLDISRLDAGVIEKEVRDFPVQTLLARLDTLFSPLAIEHGLRFSVASSSAWVRSDPTLLDRILQNLASNAIKYTKEGGVVIGCRRHAHALSIEIWDSGPGIGREHQREIFREFVQLENPEHDRSKGLGLGLAIVERMASLLGHPVRLRSVPGRGSVFAVEVLYGDAAQGSVVPAAIQTAIDPFASVRVAVIDDEPAIIDATTRLLERWGCVVVGAGSEAEMLELLSRETRTPDLLICDYRLRHGQDGLSAIRNVRLAAGKNMPAVLISGDIAPEHAEKAHASGIDMLRKPVAPARLRQVMRRLLSRPSEPSGADDAA